MEDFVGLLETFSILDASARSE